MLHHNFSNLPELASAFLQYQKMVITIVAGMFGGLGRAMAMPNLNISVFHSLEVCFYAALSAIMGYLIKSLLDRMNRYLCKRFGKSTKHNKP